MDGSNSHRRIALAFAAILALVAALNYIPGLPKDGEGALFGIFALDIGDDALHAASALWALVAAVVSRRAARLFLLLFGALYAGDGLLGIGTGSGFLDLGILVYGVQDLPLGYKLLANAPHVLLGSIALAAGLRR